MKVKVKNFSKKLNEASVGQAVQDAEAKLGAGNNDVEEVQLKTGSSSIDETEIGKALNRALRVSERMKRTGGDAYTNVLLVGGGGIGKTAITKKWAEAHNVNLVIWNTATMEETDLTGVVTRSAKGDSTIRLKSDVLRALNEPRSVLFLDEYNRGTSRVRGTLLTLIKDHLIDAGTEEGAKSLKIELKNLLFTVAAINPADGGRYNTDELDPAELSRFARLNLKANKAEVLSYYVDEFGRQMNAETDEESIREYQGRIKLAQELLKSKAFQFDNEKDEDEGINKYGQNYTGLNPRSLENLLQYCDGTKEDFLANFNNFCSPMKKGVVETILADFEDVDDKANAPFKKREKSDTEKLDSFLNDLS